MGFAKVETLLHLPVSLLRILCNFLLKLILCSQDRLLFKITLVVLDV